MVLSVNNSIEFRTEFTIHQCGHEILFVCEVNRDVFTAVIRESADNFSDSVLIVVGEFIDIVSFGTDSQCNRLDESGMVRNIRLLRLFRLILCGGSGL